MNQNTDHMPENDKILVFYDGKCGFCHGWVRHLAEWDSAGALNFAPIGGETWHALTMSGPQDTFLVRDTDGRTLVRWSALLYLAPHLGFVRRVFFWILSWAPISLGDWIYTRIATRRQSLASPPDGPCPLMSPTLRERFKP